MHLAYPLTFCVTIVFDFSWDDEEKLEAMVRENLGDKKGTSLCVMVYVKMANRTLLWNLCFDARSVICMLADNRPVSFPVVPSTLIQRNGQQKQEPSNLGFGFIVAAWSCLPIQPRDVPKGVLPWLHIVTCSVQSSFFLYVSFDGCIQCQESNVKGPFKEVKRQKHPLVIPAHILLYSEWA